MQREPISLHDDQLELFHPSQAVVHLKQLSAKRESGHGSQQNKILCGIIKTLVSDSWLELGVPQSLSLV